jgi:hypothetical protein
MVSVFQFGVSRLFEFERNTFGLFELRVHPARPGSDSTIPSFLRPRTSEPDGGLARHTSHGNYHGPAIEVDTNGQEFMLIDRTTLRALVHEIKRRSLFYVVRA